MELFESSKKFIERNIQKDLDPTSMEVMQCVVTALFLTVGEVAQEKLPKILNELNIYAENKSVLEMSHEYLHNYQEDESLQHSDACVTRSLAFDDDGSFVKEKRNLLISLKDDDDYFSIVSTVLHEFIHLLRFGGVQQEGHKYKIKDGISVSYFDADKEQLRRKHVNLEEGVVQRYTNIAMRNLFELLQNEKIDSDVCKGFMEGFKNYTFYDYFLEVSLVDTLCQNPKFNKLIEESFTDDEIPAPAIQYFNSVMDSQTAFMELGNHVENITTKIMKEEDPGEDFMKARTMVTTFMIKAKNQK